MGYVDLETYEIKFEHPGGFRSYNSKFISQKDILCAIEEFLDDRFWLVFVHTVK